MDLRVFHGGRKQTQAPCAIPASKPEAPIDYDQITERVPKEGAMRPFYGDLSNVIFHVYLAQQDASKGCLTGDASETYVKSFLATCFLTCNGGKKLG